MCISYTLFLVLDLSLHSLQLNTWKDSLPPEVDITPKTRHMATPHQLMVHIAYWWFFILLHRPYFHRKPRVIHSSDKEIDHVKVCNSRPLVKATFLNGPL